MCEKCKQEFRTACECNTHELTCEETPVESVLASKLLDIEDARGSGIIGSVIPYDLILTVIATRSNALYFCARVDEIATSCDKKPMRAYQEVYVETTVEEIRQLNKGEISFSSIVMHPRNSIIIMEESTAHDVASIHAPEKSEQLPFITTILSFPREYFGSEFDLDNYVDKDDIGFINETFEDKLANIERRINADS